MGQCQSNPSFSKTKTNDEIGKIEWIQRLESGNTFLRFGYRRSNNSNTVERQQSLIERGAITTAIESCSSPNTVRRRTGLLRSHQNESLGTERTSIYYFKRTQRKQDSLVMSTPWEQDSLVMSTPSSVVKPWEARLAPGIYLYADLVNFPDIKPPVPRYARFTLNEGSWKSIIGRLEIPVEVLLSQEVPVEVATESLLKFYGCSLIGESTGGSLELGDEHCIQDFTYQRDYFKKYVQNVGAGIERHEFAHIDCPLSPLDESGLFLLGKWEEEESIDSQPAKNNLYLTAFRIPQLHVLFVPGGTIHSNDYLQGCWRTMLSWTSEEPIDNVKLFRVSKGGQQQKGMFRIQGMDSTNPHQVERMSQDTGEADLEEGSIVENIQDKSEGNKKLKDDVDSLTREAQSL
eukprot:CAMPEP_0181136434 /NCGR_PEP_ID=MMETSP1071-20121207/33175_1 /TAXON_ID=35127 /ORGANISM="Thalassiosira sp., Strain NH16" /LENGTH=402 /DNA_ID=CAMNT_0023223131 /DNA_START=189 /DNA_END=1395 /DNA_ORIENTATION=+